MSVDRELVEILGVGLYVLDSLFLGVVDAALLMLIGRGGWLGRRPSDERVIYQARHSVLSGGIYFNLPNSIVVSDKRLTIGIAWSRAALVNVRVDAIRSVTPGRWWWRARVVVVFHERARTRKVSIVVSAADQMRLIAALRSVTSNAPPASA